MYISRIAEDGRKQLTAQHLKEVAELSIAWAAKLNLTHSVRLAASLHDMGKFSDAFVTYLHDNDKSKRGSIIHSTQGAKYVYESIENGNALSSFVAEMISMCIASHHGELMDGITPDGTTPLLDRLRASDKGQLHYSKVKTAFYEARILSADVKQQLELCCRELSAYLQKCQKNNLNPAFMLHMLTKFLFSCLIDADRYNAYCFEVGVDAECIPAVLTWDNLAMRLENHLADKNTGTDTPISRIRQDISDKCLEASQRPQGVYQLGVPTGGGKTLSSLRFALAHAEKHHLDRIIYVIPYLSVLEQTADNIRKALKISIDDATVLEHHTNLILPDDKKKMEKVQLLTSRWDSPIVVTTMVQFLESVYSEKSGKLRKLHSMTNAVLIFDEVQSLPVKCVHLFNDAINFFSSFGGSTILLCTATQPLLDRVERPIHLSNPPSLLPNAETAFGALRRTSVVDSRVPGGYTDEALADLVLEKQKINGNCLVILNTKSNTAKLFSEIKALLDEQDQTVTLYHLSTMMCPAHRLDVIQSLKSSLDNQVPVIAVSTQLIEAGVDISFGCVIRAVAGLDSIAQASGRCNRNGEDPKGREVYLVNLADENLSKLPDIWHGREVTLSILEKPLEDLLSHTTMNRFYSGYFYRRKNEMDYPIGTDGTIYDLLSSNQKGYGAYQNSGSKTPPALRQAFQTAGKRFFMIEQNTTDIIVPYGEGEVLAEQYQNAELKDKPRLLRKMGRFSVSLYPYLVQMLKEEHALHPLADSLLLLEKRYYDQEYGVCFSAEMEFLNA